MPKTTGHKAQAERSLVITDSPSVHKHLTPLLWLLWQSFKTDLQVNLTLSTSRPPKSFVHMNHCGEFNSCRACPCKAAGWTQKLITQVTQQAASCHTNTAARGTKQRIATDSLQTLQARESSHLQPALKY